MSCAQDVSATVRPIQSRHHQWIKADLTGSHNNDIDNNANEQEVRCGKANQWFCKQLAFHLKRLRPQKVDELPYYLTFHCLKTQGQVYKWSEICALKLNTIQGNELYLKVHCVKNKQVNQWSGRQRHRWSTAGSSNSTNWRLPQIRLTPRRQILLSGFRQILSTISRQILLLPIDPLCPANIHLWPATNMVGWQIFGKVSWNHEIVESGNHEMLITAGVLLC